ncbi:MAG: phosphatidylglycerol:prolipoprotein diacylglycerol transferase [Myxococcota bacterium]|jgi:phosphatidylglycerol:prolipoprotein diacylglycerol transferase
MHGTFVIFGIDFPAYFTLLMIGFMAGIYITWRHAPAVGIDPNRILDFGILVVIGGIAGGRLAHVLFDGQLTHYYYLCVDPLKTVGEFIGEAKCATDAQCVQANIGQVCNEAAGTCHWGRDCLRVFKFWYGGLTYYGGFLVAIPLAIWFLTKHKIAPWKVGDMAGFAVPLGIGFGRLGCFYAGCCYGSVCDTDLGVSFPPHSPAWQEHFDAGLISAADHSLPVHPAQLYTALSMWLLAGLMLWYYHRRKTFDGEVFWLFALLYSGIRFLIETLRADERGEYFGLSTSQGIGVLLAITSLIMLTYLGRKKRAAPSG